MQLGEFRFQVCKIVEFMNKYSLVLTTYYSSGIV